MNKSVYKIIIIVVVAVLLIGAIFFIGKIGKVVKNNNDVVDNTKYVADAIEQQKIVNAINKYKFVDSTTMKDKKIDIIDKDNYGRYLVKIDYKNYNTEMGTYDKVAYIVIYDVKEDGSSKTTNSSAKLMGIIGTTLEGADSIETIKQENNWNEPIK